MPNNLKSLRVRAGLSQEELAERMGTTRNQLAKLEGGARRLSDVWIDRAARALDVRHGELVDEISFSEITIPIMGYVGAGAVIEPEFEQVPPEGLDQIELTFNVPDGIIGLRVRGDSMLPRFRDRDVVLVFAEQRLETKAFLGEEVVVRTRDGRRFIKTLLRGPEAGTFNLESHNARTIEAVRIEWIGEIYLIVPSKQVREHERMKKAAATRRSKARERASEGMDELPLSRRSS